MELFIFIVFQLLMEVQSYKAPAVKVSPDVLRESSSVKMICETPADVTVKQCHFYINREQKNTKVHRSCELDLTGAEVLGWAAVKSPASVHINCFYTIQEHRLDKPSSHSPAATLTVLGSLQKPFISVSDDEVLISIACETSLSAGADFICSLYTEDGLLHRSVSQRRQSGEYFCVFYLSQSELFTRPVNSRELSCDYSFNTEPEIRSPRSDTRTVRGLPQAKLTASASVILETDSVQLSCENTEHLKMEMCVFYINGRDNNSKLSSSCQLSLTGSQIRIWSEGQSSSVNITCFYTVMKSQVQKPSPHSDPVTVTIKNLPQAKLTASASVILETDSEEKPSSHSDPVTVTIKNLLSTSKPPPSTTKKTTLSTKAAYVRTAMATHLLSTPNSTTKKITHVPNVDVSTYTKSPTTTPYPQNKGTWFIVLVSTGVGVIVSGLICLWFACKKRRQRNKTRSIKSDVPSQGIGMSSGPAETYSLITSVPAISQPTSVGLEHPKSHQDSTPDPTATYPFIMSENSVYQPSGVLVNKQKKEENTEENENVYHLYCTIPDKPVHSNAGYQVYSLVH